MDFSSDGDERVCAVPPLVDTVVAESPVALVAVIAFPVARVGECFARVAKHAALQPLLGVFCAS